MESDNESIATSIVSSTPSMNTVFDDEPPPYSQYAPSEPATAGGGLLASRDPRSSSVQSLIPSQSQSDDGRRKLLLVFIHGYMGSETSFQSFPAHLHNLISILLADSHVVHTKIYPRYRSRDSIQAASHALSQWLLPHESPNTDVVLLGHSMGGLVNAETILLPADRSGDPENVLLHKIIGSINFDVPFLGMHPGIIKAGLGTIFQSQPKQVTAGEGLSEDAAKHEGQQHDVDPTPEILTPTSSHSGSVFDSHLLDPNYNPSFHNDVYLAARPAWRNAAHFVTKHRQDLIQATRKLISSHWEYGSTMADYETLKVRYCRLRLLEEEDQKQRESVIQGPQPAPRVRFVNYFTASTGRPKKPRAHPDQSGPSNAAVATDDGQPSLTPLEQAQLPEKSQPSEEADGAKYDVSILGERDTRPEDLQSVTSYGGESFLDEFDPNPQPPKGHGERGIRDERSRREKRHERRYDKQGMHQTSSNSSSSSWLESNGPLVLPKPPMPPRPPLITDFARDLMGYRMAIKQFHNDIKAYKHSLKDYHKALKHHGKAHAMRMRAEVGMSLGARPNLPISYGPPASNPDTPSPPYDPGPLPDNKAIEEALKNREKQGDSTSKFDRHLQKAQRKVDRDIAKAERKTERYEAKAKRKGQRNEEKSKEVAKTKAEKEKRKNSASASQDASGDAEAIFDLDDFNGTDEDTPEYEERDLQAATGTSRGSSDAAGGIPIIVADDQQESGVVNEDDHSRKNEPVAEEAVDHAPQKELEAKRGKKLIKDRKFCVLPPRDADGHRDPCWVRVSMEGIDEVTAHCGLFFPNDSGTTAAEGEQVWSERYARLVGEVAECIEGWIHDSETDRVMRQVAAM